MNSLENGSYDYVIFHKANRILQKVPLLQFFNQLYLKKLLITHIRMQPQHPNPITIVTMSDTHDLHHKINIEDLPKGDIFIHAGDFTKYSRKNQLQRFHQFLKMIPYKHKIVIAGNHDFALDKERYESTLKNTKHKNEPLDSNQQIKKMKQVCTYLQHEMVQVQGIRIFGSPYSPQFFDWGFMYCPNQSQQLWSAIPENIDVLVTHGPPYGILDMTVRKEHAGCKGLLKFIEKIKPQVHIFGHIHEGYGMEEINGVKYINASNVSIDYRLAHPPQVIKIYPKTHKAQ